MLRRVAVVIMTFAQWRVWAEDMADKAIGPVKWVYPHNELRIGDTVYHLVRVMEQAAGREWDGIEVLPLFANATTEQKAARREVIEYIEQRIRRATKE